ncbi:MAG: acyl-CoA thioesterase [bacterium]
MNLFRKNLPSVLNSELITDFTESFAIDVEVTPEDIDELGHMNNAVYVNWLDLAHLYHTFYLGITPEIMKETQCAMVVRDSNFKYLSALRQKDVARVGTCIVACDKKLRIQRHFQMVRLDDGMTMLRGQIEYVCIDFKKRKPRRMPELFANAYYSATVTTTQDQ